MTYVETVDFSACQAPPLGVGRRTTERRAAMLPRSGRDAYYVVLTK